ncbi:MAG: hypothetical protein IH812_05665 [Proteobacteria bacterium]|nr:hypothetical protein [Pseudomonadota bacterium]
MNALRAKLTVLLLGLAMAGSVSAADNLWLGFKAGTLGLGLEATWRPLPWFDIRAGANSFDYDDDGSQAGVNYNATLHLETYYATLNFRFPLSPFRVTAGAFSNGNELQMVSMDSPSFDIGGVTFTQDEVGTLRSTTFFEDVAPYLGFGYDFNVFGKVGLNLDIGVLWQGEPSVTLTADGLLASDPTFMAALEAERLEIEAEFEDYKAFPVLSLGFSFNFF